jgi:hypothetical protein
MNLPGRRKASSPQERNFDRDVPAPSPAGASMNAECSLVQGQPFEVLAPRRPIQIHYPHVKQGPARGNVSETTGPKAASMMTSESDGAGDQFQIPQLPSSPHLGAAQGRTRQQANNNQKLPMLPPPLPVLVTPRAHASTPHNAAAFAFNKNTNAIAALSGIQVTAIGPCVSGAAVNDTAAFGPPISAPPPSSHQPVTQPARASAMPMGGEGHGESGSPRFAQQAKEEVAAFNEQPVLGRRTRGHSSPLVAERKGVVAKAEERRLREKKVQILGVQKTITKTMG